MSDKPMWPDSLRICSSHWSDSLVHNVSEIHSSNVITIPKPFHTMLTINGKLTNYALAAQQTVDSLEMILGPSPRTRGESWPEGLQASDTAMWADRGSEVLVHKKDIVASTFIHLHEASDFGWSMEHFMSATPVTEEYRDIFRSSEFHLDFLDPGSFGFLNKVESREKS